MKIKFLSILCVLVSLIATSSCSDSKSYADLLNEENQAVNRFLAEFRVEEEWPGLDKCIAWEDDSINAPYYRIDEDGNVYMQVVAKGDSIFPEEGQHVYYRYLNYDLSSYVVGSDYNYATGNLDYIDSSNATYFVYGNYTLQPSVQAGTGIQLPVGLLGYNSRANVVIKSQAGPSSTMSYVIPHLYILHYFEEKSSPIN